MKSESDRICSSGSCADHDGGPHRAKPAHVQCQTGVRSRDGDEEVLDGGRVEVGGAQPSGDGSPRLGGGAAASVEQP